MATVGVYLRVDTARMGEVRAQLATIEGAEPFDLAAPGKLGLLLETEDLDESHQLLTEHIAKLPGVLAAWPVYAGLDPEEEDDGNDAS